MEGSNLIQDLKMITPFAPAQWNARTNDGRLIIIHYRWRLLNIGISENPTDDIVEALDNIVFQTTIHELNEKELDKALAQNKRADNNLFVAELLTKLKAWR